MKNPKTESELKERFIDLLAKQAKEEYPDANESELKEACRTIMSVIDAQKVATRSHIKLADSFISHAEADIESSKVLFNQKLYSTAVEHLHQAVEKLAKAFQFTFGILNADEARKQVCHLSPLAFTIPMKKKNFQKFIRAYSDLQPERQFTKPEDIEKQIRKRWNQVAKAPFDEIKSLAEFASGLDESLMKILKSEKIAENTEQLVQVLPKALQKQAKDEIFRVYNELPRVVSAYIASFVLCIATYPHFNYVRYPNSEIKPRDYNEQLGIVQAMPALMDLTSKSIDDVKHVISLRKGRH